MYLGQLTELQMERLREAKRLRKYGALQSWQELVVYQLSIATLEQKKEIADWAAKKNKGEVIILPLKLNVKAI